eukprot:1192831-Prorocentrum_minimum.AAC.4
MGDGALSTLGHFYSRSLPLLVPPWEQVPATAPEVVDVYNAPALLTSANDTSLDPPGEAPVVPLEDSKSARQRGWAIMALRVAFLTPLDGILPTFNKFANRLLVSPLVEVLVFSK